MNDMRTFKAPVLVLLLLLGAAACGGGSSKAADGDKAAFCKTNADVNTALSGVTTAEQALAAFKTIQGKFDAYVKNAPAEVKADAQLQVDAANAAIAANDPKKLETSDPKLTQASTHVDTFCGVSSSSSSSSSSSPASTSSSSSAAQGSAAACPAFAEIQGFSQLAAGIATSSWPEIQAAFASQKDAIVSAYASIEAAAPSSIAADVHKVSVFTAKVIDAAATAQSAEEWAQAVGSEPTALEAGQAAIRMNTFAKDACGFDPSSTSSSSSS
ncbi:MAG: hypothetical protein QOH64_3168 [Acidimicrobiaceae bacterium]|jgi:hypothetical protein